MKKWIYVCVLKCQVTIFLLTESHHHNPKNTSTEPSCYRWEVVAEYINQHTATNITRQAKEVLNKAKELQHSDHHMKEAANKNAYSSMEKAQARQVISDATASQRYDS